MRKSIVAIGMLSMAAVASGTTLVHDSFSYDATGNPILGTAATNAGAQGAWTSQGKGVATPATGGFTLEPVVTSGSIQYPGMPAVGNSAMLNNTYGQTGPGADGSRVFTGTINSTSTPTVYYSFLMSVPGAGTSSAYIAGLDNLTAGTYSTLAGLFIRPDTTTPGNVDLAISNSGSTNINWSATSYAPNTALFVVGSFTFGGVATLDVYPVGATIPTSTPGTHSANSGVNETSGVTQIKDFYIRSNVSEPQGIKVDEVKVGTTWGDILPLYGDTNDDGKITEDDYALIDRGYARYKTGVIAANMAAWTDGDFNGDGIVDSNDYLAIDTAFVTSGGAFSPDMLAGREAEFGEGYVAALTGAVPEPASLGLIGCGLMGLMGRRRAFVGKK